MTSLGIGPRKHDERSDDGLAGAPWPVRAIVVLGTTAAIACYLVWLLGEDVKGYQTRTEPMITQHVESSKEANHEIIETLRILNDTNQKSSRRLERLLQQLCIQGAKSRDEQRQCVPAE